MECVGAKNFGAMTIFVRLRLKPLGSMSQSLWPINMKVKCNNSSRTESCVVDKEDFVDEEDYIKSGGSQLVFVQMRQNKDMDRRSKLSISLQLRQISVGQTVLDLVVIGCGPAGLALAAESAELGLNMGLVGPDLPFTNNYGVWEDEFKDLGLEACIVWRDTIVYLDDADPILIGRAYGRVSRHLLHEELLKRCVEAGVLYLNSKVDRIVRFVTVASGAASGKFLQYELGGPRVSLQTAYGVEVEVDNNPYDPSLMVFMDYRDYVRHDTQSLEAKYPTFLYAMPMSPTRVFFEETCLASKDAMPFDLLKKKLMLRLNTLGVRIKEIYEEEWSYIPVGGSLPNTEQKILAFGAAASMVHPATGNKRRKYINMLTSSSTPSISTQAWNTLWPQERKRQRSFFLFGLALILQLDIEGIRSFFRAFFRLPKWMWQGFLGSSLSSADLMLFAFYMFIIAPNDMRKGLIRHLLSDPTGATMIRTYLTF
ncbi:unnamed protein product [Withania somnifera]